MRLWPEWIQKLNSYKTPLTFDKPLIQLAASEKEAEIMDELIKKKSKFGIYRIQPEDFPKLNVTWPTAKYGGLISAFDGRIDPIALLKALRIALQNIGVKEFKKTVKKLARNSSTSSKRWDILLNDGTKLTQDFVIICAAQGSEKLIKDLGYKIGLEAILGQALEVELDSQNNNWLNWPAVLISNGINLIPQSQNKLLIGASIEQGTKPQASELEKLKTLKGLAPNWLKTAKVINSWHGIRCKPINQYAPILENPEPGLIIATGHYRNGILLSPATAEWIGSCITSS